MDLKAYIQNTKLADAPSIHSGKMIETPGITAADSEEEEINTAMKAAVDAGSVVSFVDGLDPQDKEDVLFSTQFAQRAASEKADRFLEIGDWYRHYVGWLETLGWVGPQFGFTEFKLGESEMKMDAAALDIIAAIATGGQSAVLNKTLEVLGGMADDSKQITIFDFHSSVKFAGNFQMSSVQKSENGALSAALGAFHFRSAENRKKFLFFSWGKNDVNFWAGTQKLTLNQTLYSQIRDDVAGTLGEKAKKLIAGVTLS